MSYGKKRKEDDYEKPDSYKQNETRQEIYEWNMYMYVMKYA